MQLELWNFCGKLKQQDIVVRLLWGHNVDGKLGKDSAKGDS